MNKPEIILVGGGGHCKSCIDVIESEGKYSIKGILDLPSEIGKKVLDYYIIGNDDDIASFAKEGFSFLITVGHTGNANLRKKLFDIIIINEGNLPVIVSPKAHVSNYAKIDKGTIIMHNAIVNAGAKIGTNCIINSKALIEHDTEIGNDCHISTNANINGNCIVGKECFIASNSTLKNGIKITNGSFVGMGSVVTKTIKERGLYFGNPAKKLKSL